MPVTPTQFNCFVEDLGRAKHNLDSDVLKVALSNSAPSASNTVLANITQIAATGGYSSGGAVAANNAYSQTSGTARLTFDDVVFTSTGSGNLGPFQFAILYNSTFSGGPLICWWNYGAPVTLSNSGETFTVHPDPTSGGVTIAKV